MSSPQRGAPSVDRRRPFATMSPHKNWSRPDPPSPHLQRGFATPKALAKSAALSPKMRAILEQREEERRCRMATRLQTSIRGLLVRRAYAQVVAFEDKLLVHPLHGEEAIHLLLRLKRASWIAGQASNVVSMSSVLGAFGKRSFDPTKTQTSSAAESSSDASSNSDEEEDDENNRRRDRGADIASAGSTIPSCVPEEIVIPSQVACDDVAVCLKRKGIAKPMETVELICGLLRTENLRLEDFERIYRHHKIRERNATSKTVLRMTLVNHGDKESAFLDSYADQEYVPMCPEGWHQVTRTAWELRFWKDFSPSVVATASSRACTDTAERLRLVSENNEADNDVQLQAVQTSHPPARVCSALDYPRGPCGEMRCAAGLPLFPTIADALVTLVKVEDKVEPTYGRSLNILVSAKSPVLDAILCSLTSGCPRDSIDIASEAPAPFLGGDAVMLCSPTACRFVGHGNQEHIRSDSELWQEVLKRNSWNIVHRIRGDGHRVTRSHGPSLGASVSLPSLSVGRPNPAAAEAIATSLSPIRKGGFRQRIDRDLGAEFMASSTRKCYREYAGAPLFLESAEVNRILKRAGNTHETNLMPKAQVRLLRSLVHNYRPRDRTASRDSIR
eukprot:gnl/TRDRNA2_/TRDRNA2_135087_c0_seq1.p1 gnl/TRDRNA2_/TRDRNA2_135087_c0~~gnl/TRDRNA2_/TRDRNA2_135087_c0_seq1.p1  ORF type:complete len:617 (-),score=75.29 gnl/TRDRNA2_/TRDRNA2_135087_c0_seq1:3-1853(-)